MPAACVGAAAAAGGLALNIANSSGGGSSVPNVFRVGNPVAQDVSFNDLLANMSNYSTTLPQQTIPQFRQAQQNISNNPYAALAQQGAGAVANLGTGVAGQQFGGANSLYGAGNQIMQTAFDPQQALYNRTQQQVMDQINAANAASGVSGPAAAGVAQQGLSNFNIDWQNNLLNRQLAGERGAGQAFAGASDLGNLGLSTIGTSSALPYNTYLGQQQNIIGGLNALNSGVMGSFALPQQQLGDIASYLGLASPGNYAALAQQAQSFNQSNLAGQGITNSLESLGNNPSVQSALSGLFGPSQSQPAYLNYDSLYGTNFTSNANDNFGYPGFDFSQAA